MTHEGRPGVLALVFRATMVEKFKMIGRGFVDLVFPDPPPCPLCGEHLDIGAEAPACNRCLSRLPMIGRARCIRCGRAGTFKTGHCTQCHRSPSPLDLSRAYGVYDGYLKQLIHALKYRGDFGVAEALGALMGWVVATDGRYTRMDMIVPVPLHIQRETERGYNQALILAQVLGSTLNLPVLPVAERIRETSTQSQLPYGERAANVRGAFAVTRPDLVRGRHVLLVDDVWTTGSTLSAVTLALKRAGAEKVYGICAAAGSLDRDFHDVSN